MRLLPQQISLHNEATGLVGGESRRRWPLGSSRVLLRLLQSPLILPTHALALDLPFGDELVEMDLGRVP